jgi:hypothetical protein
MHTTNVHTRTCRLMSPLPGPTTLPAAPAGVRPPWPPTPPATISRHQLAADSGVDAQTMTLLYTFCIHMPANIGLLLPTASEPAAVVDAYNKCAHTYLATDVTAARPHHPASSCSRHAAPMAPHTPRCCHGNSLAYANVWRARQEQQQLCNAG